MSYNHPINLLWMNIKHDDHHRHIQTSMPGQLLDINNDASHSMFMALHVDDNRYEGRTLFNQNNDTEVHWNM